MRRSLHKRPDSGSNTPGKVGKVKTPGRATSPGSVLARRNKSSAEPAKTESRVVQQLPGLRGQKRRLLARLRELASVCPFDQCNPNDCPLHGLRKLQTRQRLRWLSALPEEDLVYLASYHYTCLASKPTS